MTVRRRRFRALLLALLVSAMLAPIAGASSSAALGDISRQTAEVRNLTALSEVPLEVVDRAAIRAILDRGMSRVGITNDLAAVGKLYTVLGLLPPGYELQSRLVELMATQVDGLYHPSEKRIYLVGAGAELNGRDKLVLAHEVAHALQDQHFNLTKLLPDESESLDRSLATQALVEGDALVTQLRWGRQHLTPDEKLSLGSGSAASSAAAIAAAPLVIRATLSFPYSEGATLVHMLHDRGGFASVNQAFYSPPQTTEQVLHPEKYLAREGAQQLAMPEIASAVGGSWRTVKINTLGELGLRTLIQQFSTPEAAASATSGWGGDLFLLAEDAAGRLLVVLSTVWDTETDAAEFYNGFVPTVSARFGPRATRAYDEPSLVRWATPMGPVQILKSGDRVRIVYAPEPWILEVANAQF